MMRKDFIDNPWQSYRWVLDDVAAFANVNTVEELRALQG